MKKQVGFTLIEVLIYLALFGIMFGGVMIAAYNVFESTGRNETKAMVQEEGDFLMAKIDWTISGAQSVTSPASGVSCVSPACPLSVIKWDTSIGNPVVVTMNGTNMTLSRGSSAAVTLNNDNVQVSNLSFAHNNDSGDGIAPESIQAQFTVSTKTANGSAYSQIFKSTNYLRK